MADDDVVRRSRADETRRRSRIAGWSALTRGHAASATRRSPRARVDDRATSRRRHPRLRRRHRGTGARAPGHLLQCANRIVVEQGSMPARRRRRSTTGSAVSHTRRRRRRRRVAVPGSSTTPAAAAITAARVVEGIEQACVSCARSPPRPLRRGSADGATGPRLDPPVGVDQLTPQPLREHPPTVDLPTPISPTSTRCRSPNSAGLAAAFHTGECRSEAAATSTEGRAEQLCCDQSRS